MRGGGCGAEKTVALIEAGRWNRKDAECGFLVIGDPTVAWSWRSRPAAGATLSALCCARCGRECSESPCCGGRPKIRVRSWAPSLNMREDGVLLEAVLKGPRTDVYSRMPSPCAVGRMEWAEQRSCIGDSAHWKFEQCPGALGSPSIQEPRVGRSVLGAQVPRRGKNTDPPLGWHSKYDSPSTRAVRPSQSERVVREAEEMAEKNAIPAAAATPTSGRKR